MEVNNFVEFREKVLENVGKVIVGKKSKIDRIIVAFICSGHVLLEDVPGLGKTKLARALSQTLNCSFKRIQFTPDLLPSDLTGIYYYNQKTMEFEFKKGPLLSQFVLADEINRATPRTQSALLECMEERQITVEGNTLKLDKPFFVIATENPIEQFGTFPLPEAQLDRFFMKLSMGYPSYSEEIAILDRYKEKDPLEELKPVITLEEIQYLQKDFVYVEVKEEIKRYILDVVNETRRHKDIELGASPRATIALMKGCQAYAAIQGRDYVITEDVKSIAPDVLSHRIILKAGGRTLGDKSHEAIEDILNNINTPLEEI